ncbi:ribosome binding protein [Babesia ovata]|uniref:Ribosome binding protein n=1 Tax=Babesia ovata TaxID=189622 RepID=A0A2H6K9A6_9APIC|nr:ribosome binding protein [Babesia ovata]GBE59575.1 ribosome binding protein [Babesia ovata]
MEKHNIPLNTLKDCLQFLQWLHSGPGTVDKVKFALSDFLGHVSAFYERLCYNPDPGSYGTKSAEDIANALLECIPKFLAAIYFLEYCVDPSYDKLGGGGWQKNFPGYEKEWVKHFWQQEWGGDLQKYLRAESGDKYGGIIPGGFTYGEVRYYSQWRDYYQGYSMVFDLQKILSKEHYNFFRSVFVSSVFSLSSGTATPNTASSLSLVRTFCDIVREEDEKDGGTSLKAALDEDLKKYNPPKSICWKDLKAHCAQLRDKLTTLFNKPERFDFTGLSTALKNLQKEELAKRTANWIRMYLTTVRGKLNPIDTRSGVIDKPNKDNLGKYFTDNFFPYGFRLDVKKRFNIPERDVKNLMTDWRDVIEGFKKMDVDLDKLKQILDGTYNKSCKTPTPPPATKTDSARPVVTKTEAAKPVVTKAEAAKPTATKTEATKPVAAMPQPTANQNNGQSENKPPAPPVADSVPAPIAPPGDQGAPGSKGTTGQKDQAGKNSSSPVPKGDQGTTGPPGTGATVSSPVPGSPVTSVAVSSPDVKGAAGQPGPPGPGDPVSSQDHDTSGKQSVQPAPPVPPPPPLPGGPAPPGKPGATGQGSTSGHPPGQVSVTSSVTVHPQPPGVSGKDAGPTNGQDVGGGAGKGGGLGGSQGVGQPTSQASDQNPSSGVTTSVALAPGKGGSGAGGRSPQHPAAPGVKQCKDSKLGTLWNNPDDYCAPQRNRQKIPFRFTETSDADEKIWASQKKTFPEYKPQSSKTLQSQIPPTLPTQPNPPAPGPSLQPADARRFNQRPPFVPQGRDAGDVDTAFVPSDITGTVIEDTSGKKRQEQISRKIKAEQQVRKWNWEAEDKMVKLKVDKSNDEQQKNATSEWEKRRDEGQLRKGHDDAAHRMQKIVQQGKLELEQKKAEEQRRKEAERKYQEAVEEYKRKLLQGMEIETKNLNEHPGRPTYPDADRVIAEMNERTAKRNPLATVAPIHPGMQPVDLKGEAVSGSTGIRESTFPPLSSNIDVPMGYPIKQLKTSIKPLPSQSIPDIMSQPIPDPSRGHRLPPFHPTYNPTEPDGPNRTKLPLTIRRDQASDGILNASTINLKNPPKSDVRAAMPQDMKLPSPPALISGWTIPGPNFKKYGSSIPTADLEPPLPPYPIDIEVKDFNSQDNVLKSEITRTHPPPIIHLIDPASPYDTYPGLPTALPPPLPPPYPNSDAAADYNNPSNWGNFKNYGFDIYPETGQCQNPWYVPDSSDVTTPPTPSPPPASDHLPRPTDVRGMLHWLVGLTQYGYIQFIEEHVEGILEEFNKDVSQLSDALDVTGDPTQLTAFHVTAKLTEACHYAASVLYRLKYKDISDDFKTYFKKQETYAFYYSSDPAVLMCHLRDYAYACCHQLAFLKSQCSRNKINGGWRDCQYGRDAKMPSPLQAFMTDASHSKFNAHPFDPCNICLKSRVTMGFRNEDLPNDPQTGKHLHTILSPTCVGNDPLLTLASYLNCLTQRTPRTTGELVSFFHNFGNELHDVSSDLSKLGTALSKPHGHCPDWDCLGDADLRVIRNARGSATPNSNSNHNHDKDHPKTLSTMLGCGITNANCTRLLSPITYQAYALYSPSFAHTYLSWAVYLPDRLHESLEKLSVDLRGHDNTKCTSLYACQGAMPLLYTHGFTPPDGSPQPSLTCSKVIDKLEQVVAGEPIANLMTAMDAFLYRVRGPFIYTQLTLLSVAMVFLAHTMLYRLDVLRIRSHLLTTRASHLIDVKALLTHGRKMLSLYRNVDYFDDEPMGRLGLSQ